MEWVPGGEVKPQWGSLCRAVGFRIHGTSRFHDADPATLLPLEWHQMGDREAAAKNLDCFETSQHQSKGPHTTPFDTVPQLAHRIIDGPLLEASRTLDKAMGSNAKESPEMLFVNRMIEYDEIKTCIRIDVIKGADKMPAICIDALNIL